MIEVGVKKLNTSIGIVGCKNIFWILIFIDHVIFGIFHRELFNYFQIVRSFELIIYCNPINFIKFGR